VSGCSGFLVGDGEGRGVEDDEAVAAGLGDAALAGGDVVEGLGGGQRQDYRV